jgi:hypothetical protein
VLFGLVPTPEIRVADGAFGFHPNGFGFNLVGLTGQAVIIDACTNLAAPQWCPIQTNVFGSGPIPFADPDAVSHPAGFYRARLPAGF